MKLLITGVFHIQSLFPNDETINALLARQDLIHRFRKGRR